MRIDAIYENARFHTLNADTPAATRLGVLHGRIVGVDDELDGVTAKETVDLGGAVALPGFHDAHLHLSYLGARLAALDLRPEVIKNIDELYDAVAAFASKLGPDEWIFGSGYDQNMLGGQHPSAQSLDRAAGGRPVLLEHISGHMVVINTRAFELAGYPERMSVPDVPGGSVERDARGAATGLLKESAMNIGHDLVRPLSDDIVLRNLRLGSERALSYGITAAVEPGLGDASLLGNTPNDFGVYQRAVAENIVQVRMTLMPYFTALHELPALHDAEYRGLDLGIHTGLGNDRLRIGPVKMLTDGSFIGRSAAMHQCYHGQPENFGIMAVDPQDIRSFAIGAHKAGWQLGFHAIGDAAIDAALDAFEAAQAAYPRADARPRIEHFALASDAQIARAAKLGVVALPQAIFIRDFGDGMAAAIGDQVRENQIYRIRSLLDAGMVVPGSTDGPVSDPNPLTSIASMMTRRTASGAVLNPAESITLDQALRAYTYGSAYSVRWEHEVGTLRRGQLADFITLSDDIYATAPEEFERLHVTNTVIGGEVKYSAVSR